jgi:hypothetical protein
LWDLSSLLYTHCSTSYIKILLIAEDTAADCYNTTDKTTVRSNPHAARAITIQRDQITTKKEKEDIFLVAKSAYKEMKA